MTQSIEDIQQANLNVQEQYIEAEPVFEEQNRPRIGTDGTLAKMQADQMSFPNVSKATLKNIEIQFNKNLARVYDRGSHQSGVTDCHQMLQQHCAMIESVPIFLKALLDKAVPTLAKDGEKASYNHVVFAAHIGLLGRMASLYKFGLVDATRDSDPSVAKTVKRIVVAIIEMFFDQSHEMVRAECAKTFIELIENCFV